MTPRSMTPKISFKMPKMPAVAKVSGPGALKMGGLKSAIKPVAMVTPKAGILKSKLAKFVQ
jgi:hypothetical protein